jgi:hypothetical protein
MKIELEEAAENHANLYYNKNSELTSVITESIEWKNRNYNFIEGAEWQAKRMNKMNERHLRETIQRQADKIKELEADWLDEYTKGQLMSKEIEKLNRILYYFDTKLKNNTEYQQLKSDLIGGKEKQIKFEV